MKFNECHLSAELLQAIEKLGYDELLPVQEAVIRAVGKSKCNCTK